MMLQSRIDVDPVETGGLRLRRTDREEPAWGRKVPTGFTSEKGSMAEQDKPNNQADESIDPEVIQDWDTLRRTMPVTVWDRLKRADRESIEYFARRYGNPIYAYFRRPRWCRGLKRHDAEQLTMEFIKDQLAGGRLFKHFDPSKGHFRPYLFQALENYLKSYFRREGKRPDREQLQTDEGGPDFIPEHRRNVGQDFVCRCVHDQLKEVIRRVKSECERDGLADHFKMFLMRVFEHPRPRWNEIGRRFGMGWQEAKNRAWTVRDRLKRAILEEFKIQNMSESQARDEIRQLIALFEGYMDTDLVSEGMMK